MLPPSRRVPAAQGSTSPPPPVTTTRSAPRPPLSSRWARRAASGGPATAAPSLVASSARSASGSQPTTAAPAEVTAAARNGVRRHHPVAEGVARHAGAEGRHLAHDLVTQDRGPAGRRVDDLRDVGAAEPAALQAQEDLARTDRGYRPVLGDQPTAATIDGGLHAAHVPTPAWPSRADAQQRNAMATLRVVGTVIRSPKTWNRRGSISSSRAR